MARTPMFGDVVTPSVRVGSRKWYTLPLSIAVHAAVLAAVVVIPLLATDILPMPYERVTFRQVDLALPPPPPRPAVLGTAPPSSTAEVDPSVAPVEAPREIRPESRFTLAEPAVWSEGGVPGGVPGGFGDSVREAPPPPTVAPVPYRVGGRIKPPEKVRDARPIYPAIAQQARIQGVVILDATISPDGKVINLRVLRSVPLLDQAAVEAVRQWEFTPTLLNGVPVPVLMTVTVNFTLQ